MSAGLYKNKCLSCLFLITPLHSKRFYTIFFKSVVYRGRINIRTDIADQGYAVSQLRRSDGLIDAFPSGETKEVELLTVFPL